MADAFKREAYAEENVIRSMPFFAASVAAIVATIAFARALSPGGDFAGLPGWKWPAVQAILGLCVVGVLVVVFSLFQAVRQRRFWLPTTEEELHDYGKKLAYAFELEPDGDLQIANHLRNHLIGQFAKAAQENRRVLQRRLTWRSRSFAAMLITQGMAMVIVAVILAPI